MVNELKHTDSTASYNGDLSLSDWRHFDERDVICVMRNRSVERLRGESGWVSGREDVELDEVTDEGDETKKQEERKEVREVKGQVNMRCRWMLLMVK